MGVPLDCKLLVSVGELSTRKNHKVVVEALNSINNPSIYYMIVGIGQLKEDLIKLDNTGRLTLLGYRTDIADILNSTDIFVFPSLQEGLPVALMEAMAAGVPIVCSRIRGNVDLVEDVEGGYLADCHDSSGFAEAIESIAFSDTQSIKHLSEVNQHVIKEFDTEIVNGNMKRVYKG